MNNFHTLIYRFHQTKKAFTLTELLVVVTILVILSLVGYTSYSDNIIGVRDSQRINDLEKLQIDLKSHKQKEGSYPMPVGPVNITNSGIVIYQGTLTTAILSNVLSNIPKDPRTNNPYWYSITANKQQFQTALTIENTNTPEAVVKGDYKSIMKDLFPTLLLAVSGSTSFTATGNTSKFILDGGSYNLPYNMKGALVASGSSLAILQSEPGVMIEAGGSYMSCLEVYEAGRSMGPGNYQIVNSGSALIENIACLMDY